jgi:phosphoserine aminotransferase
MSRAGWMTDTPERARTNPIGPWLRVGRSSANLAWLVAGARSYDPMQHTLKNKGESSTVNRPTASQSTARRAFNFNAGPGALPMPVLARVQEELLDYGGTGMSVMEMSHRSAEFEAINDRTEQVLRRQLAISDEYAVLFLQGGASLQFAMVPMNLYVPGKPVDVLHTGSWTSKAIGELKRVATYQLAASTEADRFARLPSKGEISLHRDASYVHMCTNNTIEGTQWTTMPETGEVPLVADMSSDILSRPIDVKRFGLIFAGAQKNLGPAGVTVVIVRRELAERADQRLAAILQYRTHIKDRSLYNTPPTFAVYIAGLVLDWIEAEGGVEAIERRNHAKARLLYDAIDARNYYTCPVEKDSRSTMNVVFRVAGGDEAIEKQFVKQAEAAGLMGIKGHRSVGGMRVSLYNAVTIEAVEALVSFMADFERKMG